MKKHFNIFACLSLLSVLLAGCGGGGGHKHTWADPTYTWTSDYSSCTAERVCSGDASHKEVETKASVYTVQTPAGCETEGQGLYTVSFDNSAFKTQTFIVTLSPADHNWGNPTYVWSVDYSQCTATRVCQNDNTHIETETANSTYIVVSEASCETDGLGRYTVSFENSAFLAQTHDTVIEASSHNWGTPTYTWTDDYSSCTAERVCLNDSSHKETETVNSTYEVVTEPTEESEGLGRYTATFTKTAFATQTHDVTLDKLYYYGDTPILSEDGKTITYGLYPQKNVNDSTLVSALNALTTPESNGWYLYNNEYYAKVSAKPYFSDYKFDNGTTISGGTTYWFKCEPITWNVLSNNSGEYYIVSSILLDVYCYYRSTSSRTIDGQNVYANNYKYSDIRAWLNEGFYNSAFALGNSHIHTTTVDNSAATTKNNYGYDCANTEDKVFLPSYQDYINSSYDFSTSTSSTSTRYCRTTDWARARGAYYYTEPSYLYNGYYWTRSPGSDSGSAWGVAHAGNINNNNASLWYISVRPALTIKIA